MLLEASRPEGASTLEAATGEHGSGPANRQLLSAELLDGSLDAIAHAVGLHRFHGVVVGCLRLQAVDAHTENGFGMARAQDNGRFRCLAEVSLGFVPQCTTA